MLQTTSKPTSINIRLLSNLSIFSLLLLCFTSAGHTATLSKLKIAYVEFPPIEYKSQGNQPAGSFIEITKAVLDNAGLEYEFIFLPISRAYLYLKEGSVDMWPGLSKIPALQGYVLESASNPSTITLSAWHLKDTPPITAINELSSTKTILINGYTYGGLLYKITHEDFGMRTFYTPTHESGLKMLKLRRGDYLLDYDEPINAYLKDYPIDNLHHSVLNKRNTSFVISKKHKNAKQLLNNLDQSYNQLVTNGTIVPNASAHSQNK